MRFLAVAAFVLASTGIAHAADDAITTKPAAAAISVKNGETLRDAKMNRVGAVSRVYGDGSLQVIYGSRFVVVPASTLSTEEGKLKTSLTRQEISRLK